MDELTMWDYVVRSTITVIILNFFWDLWKNRDK